MVCAEPRKFSEAIFLMKRGMSMCVGHACVQGASKQYKQRSASTAAACAVNGGSCSASGLFTSPATIRNHPLFRYTIWAKARMTRPTGSVGVHILVQSIGDAMGNFVKSLITAKRLLEQRELHAKAAPWPMCGVSESPPELRAQSSRETPLPGQGPLARAVVPASLPPALLERVPANAECLPLPKEVRGFGAAGQELRYTPAAISSVNTKARIRASCSKLCVITTTASLLPKPGDVAVH